MNWIRTVFDDLTDEPVGGKARALAGLSAAGFNVPKWFVLLPDARSSNDLLEPDASVRREIIDALKWIPEAASFAVRSSATDEDGTGHSFAGQLDSFLYVPAQDVPRRIGEVWQSGSSERVAAYRREHQLDESPQVPAVLVQKMIDAETSGVAFGADPVSGRRGVAVVAAIYGPGTALVSGEADADTYHVDRNGGIVLREIAEKRIQHRADVASKEGVESVPVDPARAGAPALTDAQVREVAALVRSAGAHFGRPQDIEWAIADGKLFLLQSRPITSLGTVEDPDDVFHLWDNSNIAESYSGVTTPLTFSFARYVYEEVYRQFCRILGVRERRIATHEDIFRAMLGLIRGRIYYNLVNWYRVLALLPGYAINRQFMEQMMGVREPLPPEAEVQIGDAGGLAKLRDALDLLRTLAGLVKSHFSLPHCIADFRQRLDEALAEPSPALAMQRPGELVASYRELERRLLRKWDAPLLNDFFAMIFFGVSRKLAAKWCGDSAGTLQNDLITGGGGMISAEPAMRVREMSALAAHRAGAVDALCEATPQAARAALEKVPELNAAFESYLAKFGDRCLEELKLESATLHDNCQPLLRSIGQFARRIQRDEGKAEAAHDPRPEAEARVAAMLAAHPIRRRIFTWVIRHARDRVRDRENLRFERTRLFGRVRRIFLELGRRYAALGVLDDARDVFHLTVEEVLGYVNGTSAVTDLRSAAAARAAEFEMFRKTPAPPDRFVTRGPVGNKMDFESRAPVVSAGDGDSRKGLGCCPGVVRGRVRVVLDPRNAALETGEILVAQRTDPGWILLFPACSGLLVEYGSLLSHSAIVARELGISAVVSIPGLTSWLKTGDEVEFDGATGVVRRVQGEEEA